MKTLGQVLGFGNNPIAKQNQSVLPDVLVASEREESVLISKPSFTVADIHNDFYSINDKLQDEVDSIELQLSDSKEHYEKLLKLKEYGFSNSVDEISNAEFRMQDYQRKLYHLKTKQHYQKLYPFHNLITHSQVVSLCNKYDLIWGGTNFYKGNIPKKNVDAIINFKNKDEDWNMVYYIVAPYNDMQVDGQLNVVNPSSRLVYCPQYSSWNYAPSHLEKDGSITQIQVPDPIVLAHVKSPNNVNDILVDHTSYYLIVTAWGDEASDGLVINPRMN